MGPRRTRRQVWLGWLTGLLLVAACGGTSENGTDPTTGQIGSESPTRVASPATQEITGSFAVGDRELYISCTGESAASVILEAGEGVPSGAMESIRSVYSAEIRVCSYDRANMGKSGDAPTPRAADDITADLHGLLEAAEVPGPYVLVGHSAGGMFVQAYARRYSDDVAGVVAMNPVPPWEPWSKEGFQEMTPQERQEETDYFRGANNESLDYRASSEQLATLPPPKKIPFHLLISTVAQCDSPDDICARTYPAYESIMRDVSKEWPEGRFTQTQAGHEIYLSDLAAVRAALDDVLQRAGFQ